MLHTYFSTTLTPCVSVSRSSPPHHAVHAQRDDSACKRKRPRSSALRKRNYHTGCMHSATSS